MKSIMIFTGVSRTPALVGRIKDVKAHGWTTYIWPEDGISEPDLAELFRKLEFGGTTAIVTASEAVTLALLDRREAGEDLDLVWYVYPKSGQPATRLTYDSNGDFSGRWPDGFFNWRLEYLL